MSHNLLREQVIQLRLQGKTYRQIKSELGIPKATLSNWLSKLPLNDAQLELLSKNKELSEDVRIEKFGNTFRNKRLVRLKEEYKNQSSLLPLSEKELFLAGLFLYWGEGDKKLGIICISNTDPRIIKFASIWMTKALKVPKEKLKAGLHLYADMDIQKSIDFWANILGFSNDQFIKPYIKKTNREGLTYKSFGHGTCKVYFSSVELSQKVAMSIKVLSDFYGVKDQVFWYN
jgi:hypothetical protein